MSVTLARSEDPRTALEAVTRGRFLLGPWPWRSLGYVLSGLPLALAIGLPLAGVVEYLTGLWRESRGGIGGIITPITLALLTVLVVGATGPLVAMPFGRLERWRLRLVDSRAIASGHRPAPAAGLMPWLQARYSEAATWRELAYGLLFAVVGSAVCLAVLLLLLLAVAFIASPFLVRAGDAPVSLGLGHVSSASQALMYALLGLALLPVIPYLTALVAGALAAMARSLLQDGHRLQLQTELSEVSRSRARLVDSFDARLERLERDLHDGAQQRLVTLTLQLGLARLDLPPSSPAAEAVASAHEQAKLLMAELRRLVHGIHPQVLTDFGLPAAIRELAGSSPLPVELDCDLDQRLPGTVEVTAYYVVAEGLTNVIKHSSASHAAVAAHSRGGTLAIDVSDDGVGGADPRRGTGLTGLADRLAAAGGVLSLASPPGGPTVLHAELPCQSSQTPAE